MITPRERSQKNGETVWYVQFRLPGRKAPTKETFPTYAEAYAFAHLIDQVGAEKAREMRTRLTENPAYNFDTLEHLLEEYLQSKASHATDGTIYDYESMAKRTWLKYFTNQPATAITRKDVEAWVAWQRKQPSKNGTPYSAKSIKNAHGLLSSVLQHAVKNKQIPENVAKGVRLPKDTITRQDQYLKPHEFERLASAVENPDMKLLVIFLYLTGLRWGEATAVTVADLNLMPGDPAVRVNKAWKKGASCTRYLGSPKSYKSIRTVSIPETLRTWLVRYISQKGKTSGDLLFCDENGNNIAYHTFHKKHWTPAVKRANLPNKPRIHDLRHSVVSTLISQNVNLAVIQRIVGHESIETTVKRYGHLERSMFINAANVLDNAVTSELHLLEAR